LQATLLNVPANVTGGCQVSSTGPPNWTGAALMNGSIDLNMVGSYSVSVVANFPVSSGLPTNPDGTPGCNLTASSGFTLSACSPVGSGCPTITTPTATVSGCVGANSTASVTLNSAVTPSTPVNWMVTTPGGTPFTKTTALATTTDGVADGPWTNTTTGINGPLDLSATGSYAVTVSATGPNIPPNCQPSAPQGFTVPACVKNGNGNSWGCFIARLLIAFLFGAAISILMIGLCIWRTTGVVYVMYAALGVAGVLTLAALALLALWLYLVHRKICKGVCAWGLLTLGQAFIVAGWTIAAFGNCCQWWLLLAGVAHIVVGFLMLLRWRSQCKISWCDMWAECLSVMIGSVLAALNAIASVASILSSNPATSSFNLTACINGIVTSVATIIIIVLTTVVARCKSRAGGGGVPP
jgi:hypothetical protein